MVMCLTKSLKVGGTDLQKKVSKIEKIIAIFFMLLFIVHPAAAVDISALDFNGNVLGKVIPDGSVINFDNEAMGEVIGHITADGFVLNDSDELIGGIVPKGMAVSLNNNIIGKVNNDGSVTSANDSLVGKVLPNGLVINNNYDIIGAVVPSGLVYNDNGNIVGRVSGDGRFYDLSGNNNGFVTANGHVFSYEGENKKAILIGKLIISKLVVSSIGKFLGSIAPDGKVMDLKKNNIGSIHANGFVYNAEGVAVGHTVDGGYAFKNDGTYLGIVSYNGEVIKKGEIVAQSIFANRVIDKEGNVIGFTLPLTATFNGLDGKYIGRLNPEGNIVKGTNIIGKIGTAGQAVNDKGEIIGLYNQTGPVFDYLGQLKANATLNGKVLSLEGTEQGYMQKDRAFDYKEKEIGKLLSNYFAFDGNNAFIGISGIDSFINHKSEKYTISPYGYVFDEKGIVDGSSYLESSVYTIEGNILANILSNGRLDNLNINDKGKLLGSGYFLSNENKLLGRTINKVYATNFLGDSLGIINHTNLVIEKNQVVAKILPNGQVIKQNTTNEEMGSAGASLLSVSINGDYIGANILTGQVKKNSEEIGRISDIRYVIDNQGALYGKAVDYGVVVAKGCRFLGVVSDNGDARTSKGTYLGMLLANNQVINDSEEVMGYVINPQAVNGENGDIIGVETPLGTVLNFKNQNLGCQDIYGKIRNSQNEIIGQIIPNVAVMSFNNEIIGYTDFNGQVVSAIGEKIAFVDINGNVKDNTTKEDIGVLFKYTVAFDNNNNYLGRINKNGKVIADNGDEIGTVDYNGAVKIKDGRNGFALYDLYVYDEKGNTVGYISKNGKVYSIMGEMKGSIYQGFVLDKKLNLIARGLRDYDIRDANHTAIGYLGFDGKVINAKNIEVGTLADNGDIVDDKDNIIATAHPLQYYHKELLTVSATDKKITIGTGSEGEPSPNTNLENMPEGEITPEEMGIISSKNNQNIGISVSPAEQEGEYQKTTNEKNEFEEDTSERESKTEEVDEKIAAEDSQGDFNGQQPGMPRIAVADWWQKVANGVTTSPYTNTDDITNVGPGGGIGPGGRYNPQRAAILQQLYNERRKSLSGKVINAHNAKSFTGWDNDWGSIGFGKNDENMSTLRVDMSKMITADKPIPAVLARSVISLGEAPVTAIVERNIYGDVGRNVIIPAGSRVIGGVVENDKTSRFDGNSGGVKMEISWERIIRPDGIAFDIKSATTGDAEGRGGGALGYVDEQLLKKYTVPLLGTVATSALAYLMAANNDATGEVETSKQQAAADARQSFLERMDTILNDIIDKKQEIEAVTYIPAGTRIIIYPMHDLWLRTIDDIKDHNNNDYKEGESEDVLVGNVENEQQNVQENNNGNNVQGVEKQQSTGALPPPSGDGTLANMPEENEEEEGEIDLDF